MLSREFMFAANSLGWTKFVLLSKLLNPDNGYLVNDSIMVAAELTVASLEQVDSCEDLLEHQSTDLARWASLAAAMKGILQSGSSSHDVSLKFLNSNDVLCAHKLILTARSPIFRMMVEASTSGAVVTVDDVGPDTMNLLLIFMYTGSYGACSGLTDIETTKMLLRAAHKYQINDAKLECERALSGLLATDNLASLLSFAEEMGAVELKKCCVNFGFNHCHNIFHDAQYDWTEGAQEAEHLSLSLKRPKLM
jgi:hypothetical protein